MVGIKDKALEAKKMSRTWDMTLSRTRVSRWIALWHFAKNNIVADIRADKFNPRKRLYVKQDEAIDFTLPDIPKTPDEVARIMVSIQNSTLLRPLSQNQKMCLLKAFHRAEYRAGDVVVSSCASSIRTTGASPCPYLPAFLCT